VGFEKYLKILSHMRGEYLDLSRRLSEGEVFHLERTVNEAGRQEQIRAKQDQLLELYSAWRSSPSAELEEDMQRVVSEIRELSPGFQFELPRRDAVVAKAETTEAQPETPTTSAESKGRAAAREPGRASRPSSPTKLVDPQDGEPTTGA
jgi:hypothetical protein